jgi:hypothetical protein
MLTKNQTAIRLLEWRSEMKCERCLKDEATAEYRVFSEIIDMKVCAACADEAEKLGISVEPPDVIATRRRRFDTVDLSRTVH